MFCTQMNFEYISFVADDIFALQYGVFIADSNNGKKYITKYKTSHNIYYAAEIWRFSCGTISCLHYFVNGCLHNMFGPAVLEYYSSGNVACISFYVDNKPHPRYTLYSIAVCRNGIIASTMECIDGTERYTMYPIEAELDPDIISLCRRKNEFQMIHLTK